MINSIASLGQASPLGTEITNQGVNFSIFSRSANGVDLLFFDREDDKKPSRVFTLDNVTNRTYHYWHTFIPGVKPGQLYGYRVHGPDNTSKGLRFDSTKVLLDPYGRGIVIPKNYSPQDARVPGDNAATAMKSVVVDLSVYDWEGDVPLKLPSARTIIYEMHLAGFTRNANSVVTEGKRGTYAGLIEKIPCRQSLCRYAPYRCAFGIVRCK